jgi:serine/arginine repetitive matrix protein 2
VNGLRDDDDESFYGSRASFVSEYSFRDEGMQVFFKEHGRKGSKDSQSSFLSRKKATAAQAQKRPETRVHLIFKFERIRVALIFPLVDPRSSSVRRLR